MLLGNDPGYVKFSEVTKRINSHKGHEKSKIRSKKIFLVEDLIGLDSFTARLVHTPL